ncbi:OsmC family protein [Ostreibacterium oceani]|uniref:OsmC family peroxiredoxin n=1 Tax=Ostreibacterium oceani TaxID=2654998 RepID=A0A6N7EUK6_9GAMM|nr:OsmC family protein [Ostreibacterium oceani]MPV85190.1 OsmC family peroxiredoxin [Ostreibacterium oceani]
MKKHHYKAQIEWTGNEGDGTLNYRAYNRNHQIQIDGKTPAIAGSADPAFLGDKSRYNPEDLFLSSISACHMLWYLHLCSVHHIVVTEYVDYATGVMAETDDGSGRFTEVTLHPHVVITDASHIPKANELHETANKMCFIANSCNFNIGHEPNTRAQ